MFNYHDATETICVLSWLLTGSATTVLKALPGRFMTTMWLTEQ